MDETAIIGLLVLVDILTLLLVFIVQEQRRWSLNLRVRRSMYSNIMTTHFTFYP